MQAEPSCQLLFLVNSLILAFYLLLCLLLSALHFVLLPECRVYFLYEIDITNGVCYSAFRFLFHVAFYVL